LTSLPRAAGCDVPWPLRCAMVDWREHLKLSRDFPASKLFILTV
jgi:hypothetical protein